MKRTFFVLCTLLMNFTQVHSQSHTSQSTPDVNAMAGVSPDAGNEELSDVLKDPMGSSSERNVERDSLKKWSASYTLPDVELTALSLTSRNQFIERIGATSYYVPNAYLDQIRTYDPHQLLQRVPGIQIQEEEGFGLRPNIGIRGSGASRASKILIMEDGVPTAPAPYTAPAAYYFPTMGRMNSAEVRMGSAGLTAGPYTTGGAINLISTQIPTATSVKMRAGIGSFNTRQVHMNAGDELGRFGYMVEYFSQNSDGFKQLDSKNDDTGFDKRDVHVKLRYRLYDQNGHRHQLSAKFLHSQETSDETYLGLTRADFEETPLRRYAGSERDQMNTEFTGGNLTHTWTLPQSISMVSTFYGHTFDRNWYKLDKVQVGEEKVSISNILSNPTSFTSHLSALKGSSDPDAIFSVKANNRSYYSYGFQSRLNWEKVNHAIQAGIRLHTDAIDRFQWVDDYQMGNRSLALISEGTPGTESNRIQRSRVYAGYGEYTYQKNSLTVQIGGRLEYIEAEREDYGKEDPNRNGQDLSERSNEILTFLPGVSVDYKLNDKSNVFASVVRGFTPPGDSEETDPEQSINSELGFRYFDGKSFQFQLTGFWHEFQNLLGNRLVAGGNPAAVDAINGGAARSTGVEIYAKYNIQPDWPLELSYTYIQSTFQEDFESDFGPWGEVSKGDFLPYVSPHMLWAQFGYSGNRLGIFAQLHYQAEMLSRAGEDFTERPGAPLLDGRTLISAQVQYQLSKSVLIYGRANNLLDEVYNVALRPAGWRPGMPRYFEAGFEYRLAK